MIARAQPVRSLRTDLFRKVAALLLVTIGFIGALAFWSAYGQIGSAYDAELVSAANVLHSLMGEELETRRPAAARRVDEPVGLLSAEDQKAFEQSTRQRMFRVWRGTGLALASSNLPALQAHVPTRSGFRDMEDPAGSWRLYTLLIPAQHLAIEVGERKSMRRRLIRSIAVELALPLLLLVPAAIGLMWLALGDGLRILKELSAELQRRSLRDLSTVNTEDWPGELSLLVRAINYLFARLAQSAATERRFIDEAAHQLRTPLAAIKLQTQLAARTPEGPEHQALLASLQQSVDRVSDLGNRLLTLARLESASDSAGVADLDAEARQTVADLASFAALRGVALAYEGSAAPLRADPVLLQTLAANLIENAIRHAPPNSEVEVQVLPSGPGYLLAVTDAGPGICAEDRERVFARFQRGTRNSGGAGLGLAIVAEAVRVLRGEIRLADRPDGRSGLRAEVLLPAASFGH